MKIVYICSPYRGDTNKHTIYARRLMERVLREGDAPICPHLYLPQVLDDSNLAEREQALRVGLELLKACDRVAVGNDYGISEGMAAEIELARELGINICYYTQLSPCEFTI